MIIRIRELPSSDLLERDLQKVMDCMTYTARIDKYPPLHQPELLTVYVAQGCTIATSKQYERWDTSRRWKRTIYEATAKLFPDDEPAGFHFTRVNTAMERAMATVGGWKTQLVLDGIRALPKGYFIAIFKLQATSWKQCGAFGFTAQWVRYRNGTLLTHDFVEVLTGDFFSCSEREMKNGAPQWSEVHV